MSAGATASSTTLYQLPDGQVVTLGPSDRTYAPGLLFDPTLMGSEEPGVAELLTNSIFQANLDLRATLLQQVVLSGGTTLLPGFGDQLLADVRARAPSHARLRISAPPERSTAAFTGGSILASLASFRQMVVTQAAYEEHGERILFRGNF